MRKHASDCILALFDAFQFGAPLPQRIMELLGNETQKFEMMP